MEENLKNNLEEHINESIMSVKGTITNSLKQDNSQLRSKVEVLEKKLNDQQFYISSIDQYSRRNNIEIQGIPETIKDEELESKVIDIFSALNISISNKDMEDCPRLGKDGTNIIVRFVNRKHCYEALSKKIDLKKLIIPRLHSSQMLSCT